MGSSFYPRVIFMAYYGRGTCLGRILNGTGTGKIALKCDVAIQRWFESTQALFFLSREKHSVLCET